MPTDLAVASERLVAAAKHLAHTEAMVVAVPALRQAAEWFRDYERQHQEKADAMGTCDEAFPSFAIKVGHQEKAAINAARATKLEAAAQKIINLVRTGEEEAALADMAVPLAVTK